MQGGLGHTARLAAKVRLRGAGVGCKPRRQDKRNVCCALRHTVRCCRRVARAVVLAGSSPAAKTSGGHPVDEAALARLVQHSLGLRKQEQKRNTQPELLASRVRMLLAVELTEAEIRNYITALGGGPYFAREGEEGARKTLALLGRLGLNGRQVAKCLHKQPTLLGAPHSTIAAAVAWFQSKARLGGRDLAAAVAKGEPSLLRYSVAALEASWDNMKQLLECALPGAV